MVRLKEELHSPIVRIRGIRTSRNAANKTGISAVQELMIHDLAIVYSLLGSDIRKAEVGKRSDLSWEIMPWQKWNIKWCVRKIGSAAGRQGNRTFYGY